MLMVMMTMMMMTMMMVMMIRSHATLSDHGDITAAEM